MSWPWAPPGGPPPPPQFGAPLSTPPPFRGGPPAQFGAAPPPPHFASGRPPPPFVQPPYAQFAQTHYPSQQYIAYGQSAAYPPYQGQQHLSQPQYPPQSQYQHSAQQQPHHQFSHYPQQGNQFHSHHQQPYNNRHGHSQNGSQQHRRVNSQHQSTSKHAQNAHVSPSKTLHNTAAGAGNQKRPENRAKSRGVEKELALTRQVLAKLGRKLPGDNPDEIARYVAERKRNWPRSSRVVSAPPKPPPADALAQLAEGYADGCSDAEDDDTRRRPKIGCTEQRGKRRRAGRGRGRGQTERTRGPPRKKPRPVLLQELLRKDILKERHVLLQAIAHMLEKIDEKTVPNGFALCGTTAVKESVTTKEGGNGGSLGESQACHEPLVAAKDAQDIEADAVNLSHVVEHIEEVSKDADAVQEKETPGVDEKNYGSKPRGVPVENGDQYVAGTDNARGAHSPVEEDSSGS